MHGSGFSQGATSSSGSIRQIQTWVHQKLMKYPLFTPLFLFQKEAPSSIDENFGRVKILTFFNEHPLFLVFRFLFVALLGILAIVFFLLIQDSLPPELFPWIMAILILLIFSVFIRFYILWEIGGDFITEHEIIRVEPQGIFRHNIERFLLDEVKFFDLEQTGFLQSVLDCGDIHITSEMGPKHDIILTDVWPAQKTFSVLEKAISCFASPHSPFRFPTP